MERTAGELKVVWIVRDPSPVSEFDEIVFEHPVSRLHTLIAGTGVRTWEEEHTKLYTDEASAKRDAQARWANRPRTGSYDRR
jgi:hypothetical protein